MLSCSILCRLVFNMTFNVGSTLCREHNPTRQGILFSVMFFPLALKWIERKNVRNLKIIVSNLI